MKNLILVGIGGFIGSIARYGISLLMSKFFATAFPMGTFVINVTGSFIIGVIYGITEEYPELYHYRLFLATGFCGGFTTFSSFSAENLDLIQRGHYTIAITYVLLSVVLSLIAVFAGILLAEQGHHFMHTVFKIK